MINDLSKALKAILDDKNLPEPLKSAGIEFDAPTDKYTPSKDTVNLFLYDIRENVELRSNEPAYQRQDGQVIIQPPPLRVACSYLVTAWPGGGSNGEKAALAEHKLLSQVLQVLSGYPTIPGDFLENTSLAGQEPPLPMITARADGLQNPAEFWASLESRLRASLTVSVTISMDVFEPETAPMVIAPHTRFGERTSPEEKQISPATLEPFFRIGGRVTDAEDKPVENANVTVVEHGLIAQTNAEGRYTIGFIPEGTHNLRVQLGARVKNVPITVQLKYKGNYDIQLV